jgi:predicted transposase/invertase (TIGR01784 family)
VNTSDKLFFWMFQNHPDSLLRLLRDLPADATGYRFSAPVLKEREYRLDGLFLPPANRPDLPAVILEAQMAADPGFLRRLYAESSRWLQQQPEVDQWRVVVICPQRGLNFGRPVAVAEFIQERVRWIELLPAAADPTAEPLLRALALLVQPEEQIPASAAAIRTRVAATAEEKEMADVIAAILLTRFNGRSIQEICAMGGITLEEFSQTVAYREIFGQGRQEGRQEGREEGELDLAIRLLHRRCGQLSAEQEAHIRALSLPQLEALADALLDFQGSDDLNAWLAAH